MLVQLRGCHQPEAISLGMQRSACPLGIAVTSSMARLCSQAGGGEEDHTAPSPPIAHPRSRSPEEGIQGSPSSGRGKSRTTMPGGRSLLISCVTFLLVTSFFYQSSPSSPDKRGLKGSQGNRRDGLTHGGDGRSPRARGLHQPVPPVGMCSFTQEAGLCSLRCCWDRPCQPALSGLHCPPPALENEQETQLKTSKTQGQVVSKMAS